MNPLWLHLGMGKTATTTLQATIFSNHPDICYLGKDISFRGRECGKNYKGYASDQLAISVGAIFGGAHLNALSIDQRVMSKLPLFSKYLATRASKAIASHERGAPQSLITLGSWEGLSRGSTQQFNRLLSRLSLLNPDFHLLFTVREALSWIKSSYLQTLKARGQADLEFISFEDWFTIKREQNWAASIPRNYNNMKTAYELSSNNPPKIVPFELIKQDEKRFFKEIARALDINADTAIESGSGAHKNKTLTQAQYDFMQASHPRSLSVAERKRMFKELADEGPKARTEVPRSIASAIHKDAAPINRWLTEITKMDLASLGYTGIS